MQRRETSLQSNCSAIFDGFMIDNPVALLSLLGSISDDASTGLAVLHKWQIQCMLDFANESWSDHNPYQAIVRACNGSGKDKYIIAPCAVWLTMRYKKALSIVTSASGTQLDRQTCRYIKELCEAVNRFYGIPVWKCNYRNYVISFGEGQEGNESFIYCYATDEAGKAEGYHPQAAGSKMGIFVSEDKSVDDEINNALNKCTGYTHRVHASTPGMSRGHFYEYDQTCVARTDLVKVTDKHLSDWIRYHVKAKDCSHLSTSYIEQMKRDLHGENTPAYRSQVDAEFTDGDEMVVVSYSNVWRSMNGNKIAWRKEKYNTAGLDLSDNVAETALSIRNGNKHIATEAFRIPDDEDRIRYLEALFRKYELDNPEALIFGDAVGIGKPILSRLRVLG